jgi:hypothetical protein
MAQSVPNRMNESEGASNIGWIAGFIVIAVILAIGGAFWFMYHPM